MKRRSQIRIHLVRSGTARSVVIGATTIAAMLATQQTVSLAQRAPQAAQQAAPQAASPQPEKIAELPLVVIPDVNADEEVIIDGRKFGSWAEYFSSDFFAATGKRCGFMPGPFIGIGEEGGIAGGGTADCAASNTNPGGAAIYAPTAVKFRIPVVVNVITNGATGNLSNSQVQANIIVLNEDFKALAGTPGASGNNGQIEFVLTDDFTTAPAGAPTGTSTASGIWRYNNSTWYSDGGSYFNSIARDAQNYFNIYTNSAGGGGTLGYTTSTSPVGGAAGVMGSTSDRVVILWSVFGDPCPGGGVYCTGRTLTHEVGHYLGLYHPWEFGCDTGSCATTGDRVCDTNKTFNAANGGPNFGCPTTANTCGDGVDNVRNYMDYTDDSCMTNFTVNQNNRMRCVLDNWRINLPYRIPIFQGNFLATPNVLTAGFSISGTTVCDQDFAQPGMTDGAGDSVGAYAGSPTLTEAGDEVAYKINHTGGNLKVTLTGLASDLDLFILTATGTPASTIARSTLTGTTSEQAVIENAAAGTYFAVVETFAVSSHSVYGSPFAIRYTKCTADVNNSNAVDVADLLAVISNWGACPTACSPRCPADIAPAGTGNCAIDVADLLDVITSWGSCPS